MDADQPEEPPGSSHVPYSRRPEWVDVQPLPPPRLPQPVVEIAPDPVFGDLMPYFWAAVKREASPGMPPGQAAGGASPARPAST
jgi:hypothetical protein